MKFDYSKLRGRIVEKFGSEKKFAEAFGISGVTMSRKLNGKTAISMEDIIEMSSDRLLDIRPAEYHEYFFAVKVHA